MAKQKKDDRDRAARSGFGEKLRAYFRSAEDEVIAEGVTDKVMSAPRLAQYLTDRGEPVSPRMVGNWRRGAYLPNARYIPLLEKLLGAPWSYLDDPATTWPRKVNRQTLVELLSLLSDEEVGRFVAEVRARTRQRQARPA